MKISLIAAMANNRVIGLNNKMPWHLPADLQHFKKITMGKPIIMGRKTFESIGRPLPGRRNIIITRNQRYTQDSCEIFHTIDDALYALQTEDEVIIIGGAQLYEEFLPKADRLYLTLIELETEGDALFPEWNESEFSLLEQESHQATEQNHHPHQFLTLDRI